MVRCSAHCSACDTCFSSIQAFDSHRYGSHAKGRKCRSPEKVVKKGERVLTVVNESGTCPVRLGECPSPVWGLDG